MSRRHPARGRMPRKALLALVLTACACASVGVWAWMRLPRSGSLHHPPVLDVQGVDPAASEAIHAACELVEREPGSAAAWGRLGMVLLAHDFFIPAAASLEQASLRDAADARWPYLQGLACLRGAPDTAAAIACLKAAVQKSSVPAAVRLKLAEVLLEQGDLREAEAWLQRVFEADPKDARVLADLGRAAYLRGDLKRAIENLSASAAAAPSIRATHALLAEVQHRLGNTAAADAERRAIATVPDSQLWPDPYWQQVVELWTGAMASIERANDLYQRGRAAEAIQFLRDTAARYPGAVLVHLSLGRFLLQSGNAAEAEVVLGRAASLAPGSFEARFELASALQAQNKAAEAAAAFAQTLELKPDYPPAHYQLAQCRLHAGDREGAVKSLLAAVRYRPSYAQAHRELGYLLLTGGKREEGVEHLRSALELNPADREAARLLEAAAR